MTIVLAALMLLQSAEELRARFDALIGDRYPELSAGERAQRAGAWAGAAVTARASGYDLGHVLDRVEGRLAQPGVVSADLDTAFRQITRSARDRLPPETSVPEFPGEFATQERGAHLDSIGHYVGEVLGVPPATDAQKEEIRRQVETLAAEVRSAARSRIQGPFRDGIIDRCVEGARQNLLGPELGDPLEGGLGRPLAPAELTGLLGRIREQAARMPPVDASSPEDERLASGGRTSLTGRTPALGLAMDLCLGIYAFADANYPKYLAALQAQEQAVTRAGDWIRDTWGPIERRLEAAGAKSPPLRLPEGSPRSPSSARLPDPTPSAPAAPATGPTSSREPAGSRMAWIAIILLATTLVVGGSALRRRARHSRR